VLREAVLVEDSCMRRENVSSAATGAEFGLAGQQRRLGSSVIAQMQRVGLADHDGAHDGGVVVSVDAGEFQRDLVLGRELAPARFVAAEQGVAAGADDEFVGGIVAAACENRVVLRCEDIALVGPGTNRGEPCCIGCVRERRGAPDISDLLGRFHGAQARDDQSRHR
jgi:hypothetical protein